MFKNSGVHFIHLNVISLLPKIEEICQTLWICFEQRKLQLQPMIL